MSTLSYAGIELGELRMLDYRADVLTEGEGKTYLGTRYTLSVRGTYNPRTVAYNQIIPGPPIVSVGTMAPTTEWALRHALSQPRGTLLYQVAGDVILRSPMFSNQIDQQNPYPCDIENGPWPVVRKIDPRHGAVKTFVVDFTVTTTLNECNRFVPASVPSVLLSHRWREMQTLDQDFFETRVIQGRAVFRADRLRELGAQADDYRAWLLNPVLRNYKREQIEVRQTDDGRILEYQAIDRLRALNILAAGNARNVTRIEAFEIQGATSPGGEDLLRAGFNLIPGTLSALRNLDPGALPNPFAVAQQVLPTSTLTVVVRIWGNRNATREQLMRVGVAILTARRAVIQQTDGTYENVVTQDLGGKFVEVRTTVRRGPLTTSISGSWTIPFPPADDSTGNILVTGNSYNLAPPSNGGTRGTDVKHMTPAALAASCEVPPYRPDPEYLGYVSRSPP